MVEAEAEKAAPVEAAPIAGAASAEAAPAAEEIAEKPLKRPLKRPLLPRLLLQLKKLDCWRSGCCWGPSSWPSLRDLYAESFLLSRYGVEPLLWAW